MKSLTRSLTCFLSIAALSSVPLHAEEKAGSKYELAQKEFEAAVLAAKKSMGRTASAKDIVDTAVSAGSFKTLAAALTAAGLVDALKGEGPFTVFAPTDAAFAKLPPGTVESLLKPENKAKLTEILTYHVVAGEVPLSKALELGEAKTLQGSKVNVLFEDGSIKIGKSTLATADIKTTNGVIHVIDTVLMPAPSKKSVSVPQNSKNISDLTVDELTELLKVINIQIQTK